MKPILLSDTRGLSFVTQAEVAARLSQIAQPPLDFYRLKGAIHELESVARILGAPGYSLEALAIRLNGGMRDLERRVDMQSMQSMQGARSRPLFISDIFRAITEIPTEAWSQLLQEERLLAGIAAFDPEAKILHPRNAPYEDAPDDYASSNPYRRRVGDLPSGTSTDRPHRIIRKLIRSVEGDIVTHRPDDGRHGGESD